MNLEKIKEEISAIKRQAADDPETAHSLEDNLYFDFVKFVAQRKDKIGKFAQVILKTKRISFPRWCA